jgi:hypothetical protein
VRLAVKARSKVGAWLAVGACCLAAVIETAVVARQLGSGGTGDVAAALVLAAVTPLGVALAARRMRGGWFPVIAAATYVGLPLIAVRYFFAAYRHVYVHQALPWLLGLERPLVLASGLAIVAGAALAPRFVFALSGLGAFIAALAVWGTSRVDAVRLGGLHETAWSLGIAEWLVLAGALGAILASPLLGVGVGGWLALLFLRATHDPYATGAFWRQLAPAAPALAILTSSIWLLVPPLPRPRPPDRARFARSRS